MRHQTQGIQFQPLTCIRQLGISRDKDGSVTYTFLAQISRDLSPVLLTLHVSPSATLASGAVFDEKGRIDVGEEDGHKREDAQLSLPLMGPGV